MTAKKRLTKTDEKKLLKDSRIRSYKTRDRRRKYRVRFKRTIFGKVYSFEKQGFTSFEDAEDWANDAEQQARRSRGAAKNMTIEEYYEVWSDRKFKTGVWSVSTLHNQEGYFRVHLLPVFGKMKLTEINRKVFQDFLNELAVKKRIRGKVNGYSELSMRTYKDAMSALLNEAVDDELIPLNRIAHCRVPKTNQHQRNTEINEEQYKASIEAANKYLSPMELGIFYGALLALRRGEILGLRPKSIFPDHLHLDLARVDYAPEGNPLKTRSSYRDVPITNKVYEIFEDAMLEAEDVLTSFNKQLTDDTFIFVSKLDGAPIPPGDVNDIFDYLSNKIGFHIYPHLMRHAFATFAVEHAVDRVDIMNIMGHSKIEMTTQYDTGSDKRKRQIIDDMDAF